MKDTRFRKEGPGMGVDGVTPYDNRVLSGDPGVLESVYDILNACTVG